MISSQLNRCTGRSSRYQIDYRELRKAYAHPHRYQKQDTKKLMRRLNRRLNKVMEAEKG